jgi:hypothetical protein
MMDLIDKMTIKMPISLQHFKKPTTMKALSVTRQKRTTMPLFKLATLTPPNKHGCPTTSNYY